MEEAKPIPSFQSLSRIRVFATPWTAALQASLSITNSQNLFKLMSIESVMPSNHLVLSCPLLLPSVFPSIRVFSNESFIRIRWSRFGASASASVLPMDIQDWFPLGWTGWISLQSKGLSRVFSNTTVQKHQFFSAQLALWSNSHIHTWLLENNMFIIVCFPDSSVGKESTCHAGDPGLIPGLGRSTGEGISYLLLFSWASLVDQLVKSPPAMRETWVRFLGWEDPLKKGKATHSSTLAWRIPWIV